MSFSNSPRGVLLFGFAIIVAGCSGSTEPPKPAPVATSVAFVAGTGQTVLAGTQVPVAPVVQVRDQSGNAMAGVSVLFTIGEGDGSVAGTPVTTDASGNATAIFWKLGKSAVPQSLRATASGVSALVSATVSTGYSVDLRFFGPPMPDSAMAAFTAAAARISGAIVGDVPDVNPTTPTDLDKGCGVTGVTLPPGPIDDIIIYASVAPIDGPGKVLASSGPCFIRTPGKPFTVIGTMQFDSDDIGSLVSRGSLRDVIQHEMLHVVGFGTLWDDAGLLAGGGTVDSRFTGPLAISACVAAGGTAACNGSVPVENTGGAGTADGHWRETTFGTELMTGFINCPALPALCPPGSNPLSAITIQSLADLGYQVNTGSADPYALPGTSAFRFNATLPGTSASWEIITAARALMTRDGHIIKLQRQ